MIGHIVLLKLKPYTIDQQLQDLIDVLMGMKAQISGIVDITAGINNRPEGKSHGFSYGLICRFVHRVARDNYLPHPKHIEVATQPLRPLVDDLPVLITPTKDLHA